MKVPSILTMSTSSDAEVPERGEAGAEIVDRHAAAEPRAARPTKRAASSRFLIIAVSVISTISRSASAGRAASAVVSRDSHSVSPTVSAETLIEMRRSVRTSDVEREVEHVAVDQADQPEPLGEGRRSRSPRRRRRRLDPDQRLVEVRRPGLDVDHRLEGEAEPALLERRHQLGGKRRVGPPLRLPRRRMGIGLEVPVALLAGEVERLARARHRLLRRLAVAGQRHAADRHRHRDRARTGDQISSRTDAWKRSAAACMSSSEQSMRTRPSMPPEKRPMASAARTSLRRRFAIAAKIWSPTSKP